jgi:Co/Zn/Cd efflux system component
VRQALVGCPSSVYRAGVIKAVVRGVVLLVLALLLVELAIGVISSLVGLVEKVVLVAVVLGLVLATRKLWRMGHPHTSA